MTSLGQKTRKPREKNERLSKTVKAMLDNVMTGISIISPKMEVVWCNKVLKKQFPQINFRKRPLCYQSFYSPPKKKICDYCPTTKAFKTGKISFAETDICADGRIYNLIIIPVRDKKGRISYVVETVEDITKRKQAERALRNSEEHFRAVAQTATDAIITLNGRGKIVFWNHAAETVFGYSADEMIRAPLALIIPKRFRGPHQNSLQRVIKTGKSKFAGKTVEFFGLRKDGSEFPIELSLAIWKNKEGSFFTGIVRDITERKQAEKALKKSQEELKAYSEGLEKTVKERTEKLSQLVESYKEFIAYTSHELRTPLSIIKAVVETELDSNHRPATKQLALVNKKVDQITQILNDLMLVSRLDIGSGQLRKTKFKLKGLIDEVFKEVTKKRYREAVKPKVGISCPETIQLYTDRVKLSQVLINLLKNSLIHAKGQPQIFLKATERQNGLQMIIEDNNPSISQKEHQKIFERFYQGKSAKKKGAGLGLGLYISKRLVELMRGDIWVEKKKDGGNRFIVQLPISSQVKSQS